MIAWHDADMYNRMYCNLTDGRKIAMPRYYKDKLYTKEDREHIGASLRVKMLEAENKERQEQGELYERNRAERVKAAFKRMHNRSTQGGVI